MKLLHPSFLACGLVVGLTVIGLMLIIDAFSGSRRTHVPRGLDDRTTLDVQASSSAGGPLRARFKPRRPFDAGGYSLVTEKIQSWDSTASLKEVSEVWERAAEESVHDIDRILSSDDSLTESLVGVTVMRAALFNYQGQAAKALEVLSELRSRVEADQTLATESLYTLIYLQGITSLRLGETENCVMCRGESSCILPISSAARHLNETGSRLAIKYFTEYLEQFPEDLNTKWLLNIAHMTLGEHPGKVEPRFLVSLEKYQNSEFDIGKFRDVGHRLGLDRLNRQGGGLMEDFDNDGLLDIATTANEPHKSMELFGNRGNGSFSNLTELAGLEDQVTGLYCVQTDYDNDGYMDIFVPRGAWLPHSVRPSLLRNNRNGTFTDVTKEAGLAAPTSSLTACWADYDNDGDLDLFLPDEQNRLYRNLGDGRFEEKAVQAGLAGGVGEPFTWRSGTWIDFDNDRFPDLFVNSLFGTATLYRNNQNGTFADVTGEMGIRGPKMGFACWAWDYDNDGWLDIFATSYDSEHRLESVVSGLIGQPHKNHSNVLYRNLGGKGFQDVTRKAGLDLAFATMGCNFADFDNDGFLDFYLGTGDPELATLVPNRMFKNVGGQRFSDITGTSGTGHLQKGHSVACGDWDRNGTVDIFIQMGGVTPADRFHNLMFQNPGQGNNWLNLKLRGKRSNRAAIGARIKVVTAGENPQTIHRQVSSGSSFGANPLEQMIGLGKASQVALLEVFWPTSGATQVFHDLAANQALEITEDAAEYRRRSYQPIALPADE
jgi:hypothetical protein